MSDGSPFSLTACYYLNNYHYLWYRSLIFDGKDEYVAYIRPHYYPWTPLYRVSMKIDLSKCPPDFKLPPPSSKHRLRELLYKLDDLDQEITLEIRSTGYFDTKGYWGQGSRSIPIRRIRNDDY